MRDLLRRMFSDKTRGKRAFMIAALLLVAVAAFAPAHPAYAGIGADAGDYVLITFATIIHAIVDFVGQLLLIIVGVLIWVAQYNGFATNAAVASGWSITRDIANMFFIGVLLMMAFATILGAEKYSYKGQLTGFLIMAVVVNFSRTIAAFLIDMSQVVMLTFVNGFNEAAGGNFADAFHITQLMQLQPVDDSTGHQAWSVVIALLLALVMVTISLGVVIIMTVVLTVRIVYLWLLIVISPLAFFTRNVPGDAASGYYKKWWSMFTKQVLVGPFMAFFLWLSLAAVANNTLTSDGFPSTGPGGEALTTVNGDASAEFKQTEIQSFIIAICLLLGGLQMSKELSSTAVGWGSSIAKGAGGLVKKGAKSLAKGATRVSLPGTLDEATGRRATLATLGTAYTEKFKESRLGRAVGVNPEYNKQVQEERNIAALRIAGKDREADAKQRVLTKKRAKELTDKGYSTADLEKIQSASATSMVDKRAALLARAQEGDLSLKGKGKDLAKIVAAVGGDSQFEYQLRAALKSAGDEDAMLGVGGIDPRKQLEEKLAIGTIEQKRKMFEGINRGVDLGPDGKPAQTHAADKLLALSAQDFNRFTDALKNRIKDALLVAATTDPDQTKRNELNAKYQELAGGAFNEGRAQELRQEMEGRRVGARAGLAAKGEEKPLPVDLKLQQIIGDLGKYGGLGEEAPLRRMNDALDRVKTTGAMTETDRDEVETTMGELRGLAARLDATGAETGAVDAAGNRMTNAQVFDQSQMMKDLQGATTAPDAKTAADHLKAAAIALENATRIGGLDPEKRKEYFQTVQKGKSGLQAADAGFEKAKTAVDETGRKKAVAAASDNALGTIKVLLKNEAVGEPTKQALQELKDDIKALESSELSTQQIAARVDEIRVKLADLNKKLS